MASAMQLSHVLIGSRKSNTIEVHLPMPIDSKLDSDSTGTKSGALLKSLSGASQRDVLSLRWLVRALGFTSQ